MTTKTALGRIRPVHALTMEATAEVAVGDFVHVSGDYECIKADGTAPVIGQVSVVPTRFPATGGNRVVPDPPYDVTVEFFGVGVLVGNAAGALSAGATVGVDTNGNIAAAGVGVATIGILLTDAAALDDQVDVAIIPGL